MLLSMNPLLPCLACPMLALAQAPLQSPEGVAAAERAFAALASTVGTPAAFLATLTEDALVFTPKPGNGPAVQRAKAEDGSRLRWAPEHVELAASGDFAISTGPWAWCPKPEAPPAAEGHFLSLWVLREGRWRVLLDVGTPHASQGIQPLETLALQAPRDPAAREALAAAWKQFDATADRDLGEALAAHGAADVRLYRRGQPVKAGARLVAPGTSASFVAAAAHVAASADLALRWGQRTLKAGPASAVQVWRRGGSTWRLAMDVELPLPPAKP